MCPHPLPHLSLSGHALPVLLPSFFHLRRRLTSARPRRRASPRLRTLRPAGAPLAGAEHRRRPTPLPPAPLSSCLSLTSLSLPWTPGAPSPADAPPCPAAYRCGRPPRRSRAPPLPQVSSVAALPRFHPTAYRSGRPPLPLSFPCPDLAGVHRHRARPCRQRGGLLSLEGELPVDRVRRRDASVHRGLQRPPRRLCTPRSTTPVAAPRPIPGLWRRSRPPRRIPCLACVVSTSATSGSVEAGCFLQKNKRYLQFK